MFQDINAAYWTCNNIWTIFNRNTHTCENSSIEIEERENSQDNIIHTLSFVPRENSQERKQTSYGDL